MREEYLLALEELKKADENFQYAASEYIDVAILQLNAARAKVDSLLRELKGGERVENSSILR